MINDKYCLEHGLFKPTNDPDIVITTDRFKRCVEALIEANTSIVNKEICISIIRPAQLEVAITDLDVTKTK